MTGFAHPWLLLLAIPAAALWYWWLFYKARPGVILPDVSYAGRGGVKRRMRRSSWLLAILHLAALLLMVAALARPRLESERIIIRKQGIDVMMVLDLSGSMRAIDVPQNVTTRRELQRLLAAGELPTRLEVAKRELAKFITERPNDRIGLIGFAEYGYALSPPTLDHDWLIANLEPLEPGMLGDNTGIASPLAMGIRRLADSAAPRRVLVLFTDGRNNVAHRLTPLETAELAKAKNVTIYTVGIGSGNAVVERHGRYVQYPGEFDEELLRAMAEKTDGKYFHAKDAAAMGEVMDELNSLEKTDFEQPRHVEYREFAPLLAGIAALLMAVSLWCENTLERRLP